MASRSLGTALGPIKKRSIAEEVHDRLIEAIASGRLSRGERVVETDIADDLGVSRIPVREALFQLGSVGVLQPAGTRGWQVAAFDERQISEIYQVRLALETMMLTEAQAKVHETPAALEPLNDIIAKMHAAVSDRREMNRLDLAFHRHAVGISDNRLGIKMWEGLSQHVLIIFEMEIYRIPDPKSVVLQHEQLRDALATGSPASLAETLREHITGQRTATLAINASLPKARATPAVRRSKRNS